MTARHRSVRITPAPGGPPRADERGIALVLALIFSILLYILVAELVVAGRMVRATGENDALLARMRQQMLYQLTDAEDQLLQDLAGGAAGGGEGGGALAGAMPGGQGGAGGDGAGAAAGGEGGEGGEEEEEDPATKCDGSRDGWFEPVGHPDNDLTTYVWVEDENRKFNVLAIWSPDEKFADFSRDRMVRLIDSLREDTPYDLSSSDAGSIVREITEWGRRGGTDQMPRPRLKSDDEKRREITPPMHLDELLMLPSITEDVFFDKVVDGRVYLGLESVLTLWTSLRVDPGNPEKNARLRAAAEARGEKPPAASGGEAGGQQPAGNAGAASSGGAGGNVQPGGEETPPPQPEGLGILVNVNTASRPVLRALFPPDRIPDRVIDAIIEYRNEVDEEATRKEQDEAGEGTTELSDFGDLRLGTPQKRKVFTTTADLEEVEEFAKLADPQVKADFQAAVTTQSEVFSIHLATLFKRSEENRIYVLRRARSIVLRVDDGADGQIVPLVPFEERIGLRVMPVDLQEDMLDLVPLYNDLDQFAQEDRAWNPFLVDFYLPKEMRERFYTPR